MKRLLLNPILLIVVVSLSAQLREGMPAPQIFVDEWVNSEDFTIQDTKGKAVVLDFWFTSCAPCVYTIPHLNELTKEYQDENIVFIALTIEKQIEVAKFLTKKKILAYVATDTTHQTIIRYGVSAFPTTFLIDAGGTVRWRGSPSHLTRDMLDELIDQKHFPQVKKDNQNLASGTMWESRPDRFFPIEVKKNDYMDQASSGMQSNSSELSVVNQPLPEVMSLLLQKRKNRILVPNEDWYDIRFKIPTELPREQVPAEIVKSILNELSYEMKTVKREVIGYELKMTDMDLFVRNAIDTTKVYYGLGTTRYETYWQGKGAQIPDLVKEMEDYFGVFIDDETKLNGFFEFKFPFQSFKVASEYLLNNYGLELVRKELNIEVTQIGPKHN